MQVIRRWSAVGQRLSTVGLVVGTLFFAFSLTPSLLPRPFVFQGIVSGLSLTLGYALGAADGGSGGISSSRPPAPEPNACSREGPRSSASALHWRFCGRPPNGRTRYDVSWTCRR